MNRLTASLATACAVALFSTTANAETVDELKRELAAKRAYIAKLERRLRDLEQRPPAPKPSCRRRSEEFLCGTEAGLRSLADFIDLQGHEQNHRAQRYMVGIDE
jgi:hypothetical protein